MIERDEQRRQEERQFWKLAHEALREVESWPKWKQAAAGGVLPDPSVRNSKELRKASS